MTRGPAVTCVRAAAAGPGSRPSHRHCQPEFRHMDRGCRSAGAPTRRRPPLVQRERERPNGAGLGRPGPGRHAMGWLLPGVASHPPCNRVGSTRRRASPPQTRGGADPEARRCDAPPPPRRGGIQPRQRRQAGGRRPGPPARRRARAGPGRPGSRTAQVRVVLAGRSSPGCALRRGNSQLPAAAPGCQGNGGGDGGGAALVRAKGDAPRSSSAAV